MDQIRALWTRIFTTGSVDFPYKLSYCSERLLQEEDNGVKVKGENTHAEITESIKDSFQIAGRSLQAGGADFQASR